MRVANEMSKLGYKVLIISYDNSPSTSFYKISKRIEWMKCGNGLKPHKSAKLFKRLKQIYHLRSRLKEKQITHLITFHHGLFPRSLLATLFLPIINIVSERNSLDNYKYIKLLKLNIGFLSMFFADKITIQLDNYINDYPIFLRKKIRVVPNQIKAYSSYQEPKIDKSIISMMGRLCHQKNFTPLLDQCIQNIELCRELKIKIAGEGELRTNFESRYKELISLGILELSGNIKNTDSFLRSSTLFCFPSLWEGYPNALVEALGAGLPIILSSRMKDLKEFVENNFNGMVVEDCNYLNSIMDLLNRRDKLKKMSKRSFQKYKLLANKSDIKNWVKLIY